jgi:hypothetical protein
VPGATRPSRIALALLVEADGQVQARGLAAAGRADEAGRTTAPGADRDLGLVLDAARARAAPASPPAR